MSKKKRFIKVVKWDWNLFKHNIDGFKVVFTLSTAGFLSTFLFHVYNKIGLRIFIHLMWYTVIVLGLLIYSLIAFLKRKVYWEENKEEK